MKRHILTFVLLAILMTVVFMAFARDEQKVLVDLTRFNSASIDLTGDFKRLKDEAKLNVANNMIVTELKASVQNMAKEKVNP